MLLQMNQKAKFLIALFFLSSGVVFGQMDEYDFKRRLTGIENQWHTLTLPDEIYGHLSPSFGDVRIYGLTAKKDTISAAYLIRHGANAEMKSIRFNRLNSTKNANGSYTTFELVDAQTINEIELKFTKKNFDWKVQLEGSHSQKEWFTILDDYRILAIHQNGSDFEYTKLKFKDSNYRFFRVLIKGEEATGSMSALLFKKDVSKVEYKSYLPESVISKVNKKSKSTEVFIDLKEPVPVAYLKIILKNQFSFHRPVTVLYARDSIKNENGWQYQYAPLTADMLHSQTKNELLFKNRILRKLKIIIDNQDNQPLDIGDVEVKGHPVKMVVRITEPADYYLVYGQKFGRPPSFDISEDVLPAYWASSELTLGDELIIEKKALDKSSPLFENKTWLWVVMGMIILLLGWFSIKMMRDKE